MMLLGLVLHSAANYTHTPLQDAWPYQDAHRNILFDISLGLIHVFRMPVFFVMAGFFAALLLTREGVKGFITHRIRRLVLPLILSWPLIFPAIKAGFEFAKAGGGRPGLDMAAYVIWNEPYAGGGLAHLWFIWQLFLLCVSAVIIRPIVMRVNAGTRERFLDRFARFAPTWRGCVLMGAISIVTLMPMHEPTLDTSVSLLPALRVLVAYAVCFGFGWLLFARPVVLTSMAADPWRPFTIGLVVALLHLGALGSARSVGMAVAHPAGIITAGFAMWFLAYGLIGLAMRYFADLRPSSRYLADASYWMYILHLPLVIWLAGVLSPVALPALVKFAIVLGLTTLVTLVSYQYCVRSTALGVLLSGRRYPGSVRGA